MNKSRRDFITRSAAGVTMFAGGFNACAPKEKSIQGKLAMCSHHIVQLQKLRDL